MAKCTSTCGVNGLDSTILDTKQWVERVVIGLNLCPFAEPSFSNDQIRYAQTTATDPHEILADLVGELRVLARGAAPQTTLLVITAALSDFGDYLDIFAAAEDLIEQTGHAQQFQLVSFHPDYCFAGAAPDDAANHTNRSPHPTIHILRRADVARAIHTHEDVASIPQDNIDRLRALGTDALRVLLTGVP